jgi:hypothetical protein
MTQADPVLDAFDSDARPAESGRELLGTLALCDAR